MIIKYLKKSTVRWAAGAMAGVFVAVSGVAAVGSAQAATDLIVYTAIEADDLKRYAEEFNKFYPDINIKWVRDSTGIITAKLLAEKTTHRLTSSGVWRQPA